MFKVVKSVPWRANEYPITIAELRSASKEMDRIMSEDEKQKLIDCLAFHPECGDIIPGTHGVRKYRWLFRDKGKSNGLRVIYYYHDLNMPLYILAVYSKGDILRLTKREETEMGKLVKVLVKEHAQRNLSRVTTARGESA